MQQEQPIDWDDKIVICRINEGEVLSSKCIYHLAGQIVINGRNIAEEHARHIIEEHQP